jgi:hypothetical protein
MLVLVLPGRSNDAGRGNSASIPFNGKWLYPMEHFGEERFLRARKKTAMNEKDLLSRDFFSSFVSRSLKSRRRRADGCLCNESQRQ